ncbi:alpha-L-arabinofuranosidase C-terminal domain-containing protein [Leifsonia poae]|uniref:alpha-L-arabinofuranosidase C-terminal domain-containing protein n=1 Tax=Leifsonia poae TaxID=110933 RepID=UPI001CBB3884|nr:alpha-L-arabinofuranosidase C-terminal domain-containing protein [Leifsonia poae]
MRELPITITIDTGASAKPVSPTLFGLFLEDINFAVDGGLNANLVNNYSFDGLYLVNGVIPYLPLDLVPEEHRERLASIPPEELTMPPTTPAGRLVDRLRHWTIADGTIDASDDRPIDPASGFARLTSHGSARLENLGYPGDRPGMPFAADGALLFSAFVRADDYRGEIEVQLLGADGVVVARAGLEIVDDGWNEAAVRLAPTATALGSLQILLHGTGTVDLDEVRLIPESHWGDGDPRWSQGVLRRDLVETLAALAPRFLRFPGGCIVEGCGDGSHYKWKDTIGPLASRRPEYNLWGQKRADGDYSQSNQIGFYEYFLLCEDLGIAPIPVVWSGDSCQTRMDEHVDADSPAFAQVVQDALDLVEWATGDPATSRWAALRAEAGHPEPFDLRCVGIGNENFGPAYLEHFARIKAALDEHHPAPGLQLIVTGGVLPAGETVDPAWAAWGHDANILVDEHFYNAPSWFFEASTRYDGYPRGGARVFLGEYAAHTPYAMPDEHRAIPESLALPEPNTWLSALSEAVFLTGVERNADIVAFSCYAPLFTLVGHGQWEHDLIDFSPRHVLPTANYLVQQLFGTRVGEWIARVDGSLPDDVFISATFGSGVAHVKLVNIGSTPVEVSLAIEGAPDGDADVVLLSAPLHAVNRLSFDGEPRPEIAPVPSTVTVIGGRAPIRLPAASVVAVSVRIEGP